MERRYQDQELYEHDPRDDHEDLDLLLYEQEMDNQTNYEYYD